MGYKYGKTANYQYYVTDFIRSQSWATQKMWIDAVVCVMT